MRALLIALALLPGCAPALQEVTLVSRFVWEEPDDSDFGGISGIEVSADGQSLTTVSDRGILRHSRIVRMAGEITGIETTQSRRLRRANGQILRRGLNDAEGLAIGPDGDAFVSFEGSATRVARYGDPDGPATRVPRAPAFAQMQTNSGPEALAIDADGALYLLPERSGRATRPFPVYRFDGDKWDIAFEVPRRDAFLPVGLDIGPDGWFYLLERDFTGIGFRTRIRTFDPSGHNEKTLLQTRTGSFDNLEGIAVWQDAAGALRLLLVSDDNFKFFQRTEIVEFRLTR